MKLFFDLPDKWQKMGCMIPTQWMGHETKKEKGKW
jgi:hypothetical protein